MQGNTNTVEVDDVMVPVANTGSVVIAEQTGKSAFVTFMTFVKGILKKLLDNKMYIIIVVGIIILAVAGYFLYKKFIKKSSENLSNEELIPLPVPVRHPSAEEIQMLQMQQLQMQQMQMQQMNQQQPTQMANSQAQRPVLNHPGTEESPEQIPESANVAKHNLSTQEIAELNKKIEMLKAANAV